MKVNLVTESSQTPGFVWFWEALDLYLEAHKLKQTQQRKVIVEYFLRINAHVDAEVLHRRVRDEGHDIGLATIYRTLNLLTDAGLVEERSFQDGRSVFEVASPNSHHDHLVCTDCGTIIEFENDEIERLQKSIALQYGMELKTHRLDLFGVCIDRSKCRDRRRK
jgi:Fur family transcriptional regulator, ferric uptake regulator